MKRFSLGMLLTAVLLASVPVLLARGPGGGGRGGGGGGASRGGGGGFSGGGSRGGVSPSAGRSPSFGGGGFSPSPSRQPSIGGGGVQRPSPGGGIASGGLNRPAGGVAQRPAGEGIAGGGRPNAGQLNDFLDIPQAGGGALGGRLPGNSSNAAADFLARERPSQLPAMSGDRPGLGARPGLSDPPGLENRPAVADRPGLDNRPAAGNLQDRRQNLADNRPDRIENRNEWQDNRQQRRDEVRNQVAENYPRFDFWKDHPNWAGWRFTNPYRWATWGAVAGWVGYGWTDPTYYSYGDNVYYQDNQVYYGDQPVASAEAYAEQAQTFVESAPDTPAKDAEWMPLGVFALTQDGQATGTTPSIYIQLAISKQGVIAGTQKHTSTGVVDQLEGMADKKTQRVAWTIKGKKFPILETGIVGLTQDDTPALIHFEDGQTQQWLLVRLPEPKATE